MDAIGRGWIIAAGMAALALIDSLLAVRRQGGGAPMTAKTLPGTLLNVVAAELLVYAGFVVGAGSFWAAGALCFLARIHRLLP